MYEPGVFKSEFVDAGFTWRAISLKEINGLRSFPDDMAISVFEREAREGQSIKLIRTVFSALRQVPGQNLLFFDLPDFTNMVDDYAKRNISS